jgi:hypothetical protein
MMTTGTQGGSFESRSTSLSYPRSMASPPWALSSCLLTAYRWHREPEAAD